MRAFLEHFTILFNQSSKPEFKNIENWDCPNLQTFNIIPLVKNMPILLLLGKFPPTNIFMIGCAFLYTVSF